MKKLLIVLALPCLLVASEQKDERSTVQKVATGATEAAWFGASAYTGGRLAFDLIRTIGTGDYVGAGVAVVKAAGQTLTIATTTATTVELINRKPILYPLEI